MAQYSSNDMLALLIENSTHLEPTVTWDRWGHNNEYTMYKGKNLNRSGSTLEYLKNNAQNPAKMAELLTQNPMALEELAE